MTVDAPVRSWDEGLQELLKQGVIEGAVLITLQGRCVQAYGTLADRFPPETLPLEESISAEMLTMFDPTHAAWDAFQFAGEKFVAIQKTQCSVYALTRGRRTGLCVNNLPFGVLLTVFPRAHLPQAVVPLVEKLCDRLRQ